MALLRPEPPSAAANAARSALQSFASQGRFHVSGLRSASPDQLRLTDPHEVYNLGLQDLASGQGLDAARPIGWRYLVYKGDHVTASAETVAGPAAGEQTFAQFNEGPFVASTASALEVADRAQGEEQSKELRLLHVPGLHAMALWLHGSESTGDTLVPLAPAPPGIEPGRAFPASEVLSTLAVLANAVPEMGGADKRGG